MKSSPDTVTHLGSRRLAALLLLVALDGAPACAASYLFASTEGDVLPGWGPRHARISAEPVVEVGTGIGLFFPDPGGGSAWFVRFGGPSGARLAVGAYENTVNLGGYPGQAGRSLLEASVGAPPCLWDDPGRFTVRQVRYDGETLSALVADFAAPCSFLMAGIWGTVGYHAGDVACGENGGPCDDADACTANDVCEAGRCDGTDVVTPTCGPGGTCEDLPPVCAPSTGMCTPHAKPDASACDDGNACTSTDSCDGATCRGTPVSCDDEDPCTADSCDAISGCTHEQLDSCWTLAGTNILRVSVSGTVRGHAVRCRLRCRQPTMATFFLHPDGRYSIPAPGPGLVCAFPDEFGTTRAGRRDRVLLEPANVEDIEAAFSACLAAKVRLRRYDTWIQLAGNGSQLVGETRVRAGFRAPTGYGVKLPVAVRMKAAFAGSLGTAGIPVEPPPLKPKEARLRECPPTLGVKCVVD